MIVVLADDLSGAAELAGIARQHGLTAEVQTVFDPKTDAGLVCLDTNSRPLPAAEAAAHVAAITCEVVAAGPDWIFKKCDSLLRGAVLAEAQAIAQASGLSHIVVLPANPSRNRVIRDGCYFVEGRPLHETIFAHDPLHPRATSRVLELLGGDPANIVIADAQSLADVQRQAEGVNRETLPVGAADFFAALLAARAPRQDPPRPTAPEPGPTLVVCGSAASWSQRRTEAAARNIPAFTLPHDRVAIVRTLNSTGKVLLGIGDGPVNQDQTPAALTGQLTQTAVALLRETTVTRLMIEGGATAAAILHALGWTRLRAIDTIGDLAVLRPANSRGPALFLKPGSYPWPATLWPAG